MNSDDTIRLKFLQSTGNLISSKRKKRNITQKELGDKLGVSSTTIGRYEKGKLDIPSSNLPLISNYCDFALRNYLKAWESSDIESFIRKSLSFENISPDVDVVNEYISSCDETELSDLEEISYCVNSIDNSVYKEAIVEVIVEKHLKDIESNQYKRLAAYYKKLCEIKEMTKEKNNGTNINN